MAHIKFIRQGDSISSMLISTKALTQFVNASTGAVSPDWSVAANQPVIYPRIVSQLSGSVVTAVTDPVWRVDGAVLAFTGGKTADGKYESTTYDLGGQSVPALRIRANIMADATQNRVVGFSGTINTGGVTTTVGADVSVTRNEAAGETYMGYISATNGGVMDDTNKSTVLTASLNKGGVAVTVGIAYKWYYNTPADTDAIKDNWEPVTGTAKTLSVSRDDVDTLKTFRCDFLISNSPVASAFFDVRDDSDPLYIIPNPNQREEALSSYQGSIVYSPLVRRRGQSTNDAGWAFSYVLSDVKGSTVRNASGASITVTYSEMLAAGSDLDLNITATK